MKALALAVLALAVAGCHRDGPEPPDASVSLSSAQVAIPIDDLAITRAVQRYLHEDRAVRGEKIDVTTLQGITTLFGTVKNVLAKEHAVAVAETIKGVRAVVDQISVAPVPRPDEPVQAEIEAALRRDHVMQSREIAVRVEGGTVTLGGSAGSSQEKDLAGDLVKAVPGVRELKNDLVVHYAAPRTDEEIARDVKYRLGYDVWLDGTRIDVSVKGGVVHLTGSVGSVAAKKRARLDGFVDGVKDVDDAIAVDPSGADVLRDRSDRGPRSDLEIERAVRDAFRYDPRLTKLVPQVSVQGGEVVLSGIVDDWKARAAAEADAKNTVGVWRVRNDAVVAEPSTLTDDDLVRAARKVLDGDPYLPEHARIRISSLAGRITLAGTLGSTFEDLVAVADVRSLPGVRSVEDLLVVEPPPADLKAEVEARLAADPLADAAHTNVAVLPDGTVTLSGVVETWGALKAATADAEFSGARTVVNEMQLRNQR
jgi:osmotically-inducible protein OsmY